MCQQGHDVRVATAAVGTLAATLGGRTLLRGVVRLAELRAFSWSVAISLRDNTMVISSDTPLATLNTTAIQAAFGIAPTTLCGGSGLVSAGVADNVAVASHPIVSLVSNTIVAHATAEMWGACSAVYLSFDGPSVR